MACTGEHHSLALSDDGDVYAFGRADNNQLGLGDGVDHHTSPKEVSHFTGIMYLVVWEGVRKSSVVLYDDRSRRAMRVITRFAAAR